MPHRLPLTAAALLLAAAAAQAADPAFGKAVRPFLDAHCVGCHSADVKKGGLDLAALADDPKDPAAFPAWVKVHDVIAAGEMPPRNKPRPARASADAVAKALDVALAHADRGRRIGGRATFRRLNRTEYENTLRDLFAHDGLEVRNLLPDDGKANGFDKSSSALDVSHVQLAKYLEAADAALDAVTARQAARPEPVTFRMLASQCRALQIVCTNGDAVPLRDFKYDHATGMPIVADKYDDKERKEHVARVFPNDRTKPPYDGALGVFRHEDCAFVPTFTRFSPLYPGRYKVRLRVWGFWWDKGEVKPNPTREAARLTADDRLIGYFDAPSLKPTEHEVEVWLNPGEQIRFNAASLRPVRVSERKGRAAEYVGPGVAVDWIEVEGPLLDDWPPAGHRRLYDDLPLAPLHRAKVNPNETRVPTRPPLKQLKGGSEPQPPRGLLPVAVASAVPEADGDRLLAGFLRAAFRRPVPPEELQRYGDLFRARLAERVGFDDALRTAYKAALASPDFLYLKEPPNALDQWAVAARLSYFLWGSAPDAELLQLAEKNKLKASLKEQVERMLADPKSDRFVNDFLGQWLDLNDIEATTPDRRLYPEFGPYLGHSMLAESRAYFREMLKNDLRAAHVAQSDFAMLNQPLADLYGVPGVVGSAIRKVQLPPDSHRGGFLTQAAVLRVTANGTTTSPVRRGAWVQTKLVGKKPDPPPPDVPAIEPDVQGTTTVRAMLAKHREDASCAGCHAKIDPPGFALERFDVIGGWRDNYRVLGAGAPPPAAAYKAQVAYNLGPAVDAAGETAAGTAFADFEGFRAILLADDRQLARNLVGQLVTYATGSPVGYADRAAVEAILDGAKPSGYGVRSLVLGVVQSPLFVQR